MAGLIRREDIDAVRERARIEEIVGTYVTLKSAGVGSMKGLCPFHDERTASFHVRPQLGLWHCFGCDEGGDVISFVQKIDHLPFTEAVEQLAGKVGVQLRYEDGGTGRPREEPGRRQRLIEAHRVAEEFYAEQLDSPEGETGRRFLAERGFDRQAAATFGVGYAPKGWDHLLRHLRGRGFTEAELTASGLVSQGNRGVYDRFRGRLVWPIRDITGETVGFGARRLYEDDQGPEVPQHPRDADLQEVPRALRPRPRQAHHRQGAHASSSSRGTPTSWPPTSPAWAPPSPPAARRSAPTTSRSSAACSATPPTPPPGSSSPPAPPAAARSSSPSTATPPGRRPRCAPSRRTSGSRPRRSSRSSPDGLDPCDLRLQRGDAAVRELVGRPAAAVRLRHPVGPRPARPGDGGGPGRRPARGGPGGRRHPGPGAALGVHPRARRLAGHGRADRARGRPGRRTRPGRPDLAARPGPRAGRRSAHAARPRRGRPEGRWDGRQAARGGAPGRCGRRGSDGGFRDGRADGRRPQPYRTAAYRTARPRRGTMPGGQRPPREDPVARLERQVLEVVLQLPQHALGAGFDDLAPDTFTVPAYRGVHDAIRAAGGTLAYGQEVERLRGAAPRRRRRPARGRLVGRAGPRERRRPGGRRHHRARRGAAAGGPARGAGRVRARRARGADPHGPDPRDRRRQGHACSAPTRPTRPTPTIFAELMALENRRRALSGDDDSLGPALRVHERVITTKVVPGQSAGHRRPVSGRRREGHGYGGAAAAWRSSCPLPPPLPRLGCEPWTPRRRRRRRRRRWGRGRRRRRGHPGPAAALVVGVIAVWPTPGQHPRASATRPPSGAVLGAEGRPDVMAPGAGPLTGRLRPQDADGRGDHRRPGRAGPARARRDLGGGRPAHGRAPGARHRRCGDAAWAGCGCSRPR